MRSIIEHQTIYESFAESNMSIPVKIPLGAKPNSQNNGWNLAAANPETDDLDLIFLGDRFLFDYASPDTVPAS